MKNLLKTTVCFTTMSLTAILLPMNVMANEGEAKTITIAWTNIMESQQEIWEKYIFEPFEEKHPEVSAGSSEYSSSSGCSRSRP